MRRSTTPGKGTQMAKKSKKGKNKKKNNGSNAHDASKDDARDHDTPVKGWFRLSLPKWDEDGDPIDHD